MNVIVVLGFIIEVILIARLIMKPTRSEKEDKESPEVTREEKIRNAKCWLRAYPNDYEYAIRRLIELGYDRMTAEYELKKVLDDRW